MGHLYIVACQPGGVSVKCHIEGNYNKACTENFIFLFGQLHLDMGNGRVETKMLTIMDSLACHNMYREMQFNFYEKSSVCLMDAFYPY